MSEKFSVEIISPEKSIIQTNTFEVVIPSYEGEMGILKDHIPLITFLRPGFIRIKSEKDKEFFVEDGTVEFANNNLLILTSTAKDLSEMKKSLIESIINETEKKVLFEMLTNPGKTYSRLKIAKISGITQERSIDVMITRLRQKIEQNPKKPKYLQTVRGSGYVLWIE